MIILIINMIITITITTNREPPKAAPPLICSPLFGENDVNPEKQKTLCFIRKACFLFVCV